MSRHDLLPSNSTPFEKGMSIGFDRETVLGPSIESIRSAKLIDRPVALQPWLIIEYGLGEISRFFGDKLELIDQGIPWQRLKGTPSAISKALKWVGYDLPGYPSTLHDAESDRRLWNLFQIEMGAVPGRPDEEDPALYDVEYLVDRSSPARSKMWRGFEVYDIRALKWSGSRFGSVLWGDYSGVPMPGGRVRWSHGIDHSDTVSLTNEQRAAVALGYNNGDVLGWSSVPWEAPGVTWDGITNAAALRAFVLSQNPAYIGFYDSDGNVIGYRRCYSIKDVTESVGGAEGASYISFCARTDFGDGYGEEATQVAVIFNARPTDTARPGKLWLGEGELAIKAGINPALSMTSMVPISIAFKRTVRENVEIIVAVGTTSTFGLTEFTTDAHTVQIQTDGIWDETGFSTDTPAASQAGAAFELTEDDW